MLNKKIRSIITAALSAALLLSGCGSSAAELVDETILESTVLQTSAETTTTTVTTTATTPETTNAATTAATTTTMTETTTKATTAATTETTAAPTTTVTTTPTTTETTTNATTETTTVTTTETTTEATTEDVTADLTPEELEIYNSMPDIVFVLAHHYNSVSEEWYSKNRGFYIKKNGDIKMFNFIEDDKYYEIPERFEAIENYTCSEMHYKYDDIITQDDLDTVSIKVLIEQYGKLLLVDKSSKIIKEDNAGCSYEGDFKLYAIRTAKKETQEIIQLSGWGDEGFYTNTDSYAQEISKDINPYFYY